MILWSTFDSWFLIFYIFFSFSYRNMLVYDLCIIYVPFVSWNWIDYLFISYLSKFWKKNFAEMLQKCTCNIEHSAMFVMTRSSIWLCHINDNFISFCLLRYLHVHRGKKKNMYFFLLFVKLIFFYTFLFPKLNRICVAALSLTFLLFCKPAFRSRSFELQSSQYGYTPHVNNSGNKYLERLHYHKIDN